MILKEFVDQKVFRTAYRQWGAAKNDQAIDGWFQFDYLLDIANLGDGGQWTQFRRSYPHAHAWDFELSMWMRIRDSKQNVNFYDFLNSHETYENQSKALIKKLFWRNIWRYKNYVIIIK